MKSIRILLVGIIVLLSSCSSNDDERVTITVASEKRIAMGSTLMDALLVKENNETNWSILHSSIEGFNHEEGYEYVLEVETKRLAGKLTKYTLLREISKTQKESENMPSKIDKEYEYIWAGKILTIDSAEKFIGSIPGKAPVNYVQIDVIALYGNNLPFKIQETIHAELIATPQSTPQKGKEYIFMSKYPHPAHVLGVYMLETDIQLITE